MTDFKERVKNMDAGELERTQYLLERMLDLAERSADTACTNKRRSVLQKGFAFLQEAVLELFEKNGGEDV